MKFCELCGIEIATKDGENHCRECEDKTRRSAKAKKARREREDVLRSCGLVKVRGALGGTYWE